MDFKHKLSKAFQTSVSEAKESIVGIGETVRKKDLAGLRDIIIRNKHKIVPVISLVRNCARDAANMREIPNIADYVDLAFSWKENLDEVIGPKDPSSYFDNDEWQGFFNSAFHKFLVELISHAHPKKVRLIKSLGTASAHIAEIDGFKFGWAANSDKIDYFCIQKGGADRAFALIEEMFWKGYPGGQVIIGVEKEELSIKEDLSHKEFIKFKKCTELAEHVQQFYQQGISRSILFYGPPGCHRIGQKILMYNGDQKNVESVQVGDLLMGPNSSPRTVLELRRGYGDMVEILPVKGEPFVVNMDHILTLQGDRPEMIDISVREYLTWSKYRQERHKLIRNTCTAFENTTPLPIDPRFLGILLGDGCFRERSPWLTAADPDIVEYSSSIAEQMGLYLTKYSQYTYGIVNRNNGRKHPNVLKNYLKSLNLWNTDSGNKFIPQLYKTASEADRLALLAGLLDTDGSLSGNCFDYISKSKQLAEDVCYLSRSLGLAAYLTPCKKASQNGTIGQYYRVSISGQTNRIPTKLVQKQAHPRRQIKNVLKTGFCIKKLGKEPFYGFLLDGDHRYLLDDFTITHNSGKSNIIKGICFCLGSKTIRFTSLENLNNSFVAEILRALNPDSVVLEDIDHNSNEDINDLLDKLEDFNNQKKLIFASANEISKLDNALLRPGRFDEVIEISKLDHEVLAILVNHDPELLKITKDFPVAFTVELLKRVKVLGKEKALASMDDILARIKNLEQVNYELRSDPLGERSSKKIKKQSQRN